MMYSGLVGLLASRIASDVYCMFITIITFKFCQPMVNVCDYTSSLLILLFYFFKSFVIS